MDTEQYRKTITDLLALRDALKGEIEQKQQKLTQTEAAIEYLRAVLDEPTQVDLSTFDGTLADAIRSVMGTLAGVVGQTARQVRDSLQRQGYDLARHPNPLAAVHAVLKRMEESRELLGRDSEQGHVYVARRAEFDPKDLPLDLPEDLQPAAPRPAEPTGGRRIVVPRLYRGKRSLDLKKNK